MPRQIWNEGRVVGYSAYELYVKLHQSVDPSVPPASERQWLASTLAMGSSMLLRIDPDTNHADNENWVKEIQFPSNTSLCATNTILGSFFRGSGEYGGQWANRVSNYGPLISNTATTSPNGTVNHSGTVPQSSNVLSNWTDEEKEELAQYMKIVDGIIIQPGTWTESDNKPPEKDFTPDLDDYPRIRLLFKGPITRTFELLLTGFTIRTVVQGETGLDSATATPSPQDGDFLGPGQFPWANKIVFSVPTSYISYFASASYTRKLPNTASDYQTVKDTSLIDMKTTKPETYYTSNYSNARVQIDVSEYSTLGDGTAVLTVYQKKNIYPPALYGTFVDSTGTNYLNPLDVVAPGTVKMFNDATVEELQDYEDTFDGTFAINKDTETGTIEIIGPEGTLVPAAKVSVDDIQYTNLISSDKKAKKVTTQTGDLKGVSLSLSESTAGNQVNISSDNTSNVTTGNTQYDVGSQTKLNPSSSNINWAVLLEALANDKSIDILGSGLKAIKAGWPKNYIQFQNGLRLYISSTQPTDTDVPVGSIGIGWGFYNE